MDKAYKPSTYSRMFTYDQRPRVHQSRNRFVGIKTEMNNCERKRKLEDSGLDESYKSPARKAFRRQALSLDLGCVVDTPPARPDPAFTREMRPPLSSQLGPKHMNCWSWEERDTNLNLLWSLKCAEPQAASSPFLETNEVEVPWKERLPESYLQSSCYEQKLPSGQNNYLDSIFRGSQLEPVYLLEGDLDESCDIGLPILQSSVCPGVTERVTASSAQSRRMSEEVQGRKESNHECQATLNGEKSTLDRSCDTTLPPQVKVNLYLFYILSYSRHCSQF